jgi:hypothetical protein
MRSGELRSRCGGLAVSLGVRRREPALWIAKSRAVALATALQDGCCATVAVGEFFVAFAIEQLDVFLQHFAGQQGAAKNGAATTPMSAMTTMAAKTRRCTIRSLPCVTGEHW